MRFYLVISSLFLGIYGGYAYSDFAAQLADFRHKQFDSPIIPTSAQAELERQRLATLESHWKFIFAPHG